MESLCALGKVLRSSKEAVWLWWNITERKQRSPLLWDGWWGLLKFGAGSLSVSCVYQYESGTICDKITPHNQLTAHEADFAGWPISVSWVVSVLELHTDFLPSLKKQSTLHSYLRCAQLVFLPEAGCIPRTGWLFSISRTDKLTLLQLPLLLAKIF